MSGWAKWLVAVGLLIASVLYSQQTANGPAPRDYFETRVQPIFASACYQCHSGAHPQAGLRLDVRSFALKGGNAGPVILPGNSADSSLIHRVKGLGGLRPMPMVGVPLTADQIAILTSWVDQGAPWPDAAANEKNAAIQKHWAYVKPVRPAIPVVKDNAWLSNPIDNFVLARMEKGGLRPTREASRETLIRRVSLDLIGLPPTLAEVDAFVNDKSPNAYARLVDRLLASPQYGVRMATPWLDLARYGDSSGMTTDEPRPGAYPYRDWVVKALNDNMPFDRFVIEQLAGDMLPNATPDQKVATGFVTSSMLSFEGGTDPEEQNWIAQIDRANTLGTVLLGSTLLCAQCHNHKYDPFLQKDYYAMVAYFNNANFDPNARRKFTEASIELSSPEQIAQRDALRAEIKKLENEVKNFPRAEELWKAWERSQVEAAAQWRPLHPMRAESPKGSTLTVSPDASVLVSGAAPENDIYVIDAKSTVTGTITGFQIEALLDSSLPNGRDPATPIGGPGRDYYGNFMVQRVEVEAGPSVDKFSTVAIRPTVWPAASDEYNEFEYQAHYRLPQVWRSDVMLDMNLDKGSGGVRVPRRLVVVPQQPLAVTSGDMLRIRIVHDSELSKAALGRFRLAVTTEADPLKVVEIDAHLRPMLDVPWEKRPQPAPRKRGAVAAPQPGVPAKTEEQPQPSYEKDRLFLRWREVAQELAPLREKIAALEKQIEALNIQQTPILSENTAIAHPTTQLRVRGIYTDRAEEVAAAVPQFLGAVPAAAPQNRFGLAQWLVGPENPLTARVRVNQMWEVIFGRGIVETSEDFGTKGSPPSHPELLDWLATEFVSQGWDQKAMQRLIVTSSTYRQASTVTPGILERDPANVLFTRGPRFRVEAEMVRDITLAASGLLSTKLAGKPVMPPQPAGLWYFPGGAARALGKDNWIDSQGEDRYRRALYTFIRRTVRYPSLMVFDAPSHETATVRRPRSNTPLQALTTLNDPGFVEAAQAMARRIVKEGGADTSSRVRYGFRLATSRKPDPREMDRLLSAFEKERQYFRGHQAEAQTLTGQPDVELAAWTMVSNALLNLDVTITKE